MADVLTPFVYWGQKSGSLSLKIDLRDVTVDNVQLTEDRLELSMDGVGAQGHNKYGFELDFYLPVDPEASKFRHTDRIVEFNIKKRGAEVWPRLTEKQLRLPWLKIDFDRFACEDDEEDEEDQEEAARMSEREANEELIRKLEKDMQEYKDAPPDLKSSYLVIYNLLQFVGFMYIVIVLSYNYLVMGPGVKEKAFELVGSQIMVCQGFAVLEVINPLLGLVKTGVTAPLMQVVGRNFILFGLILQDFRLQIAPVVWYLLMTWSAIEIIRYPFYMLSTAGREMRIITWLRYTVWIPLYPLGILFEATVVIMSVPLFEESLVFSLQLPNSANFAFYFPWFLQAYLLILATSGVKMLHHMYTLRKKKLYPSLSRVKTD